MLSSTRSSSRPRRPDLSRSASVADLIKGKQQTQSSMPPEIVSVVFSCMPLQDLLIFRTVSSEWKELVDLEARLRFMKLTGDESSPFVLQAGPPALFDVTEFLALDFSSYGKPARGPAPLIGTLRVSHQDQNSYHKTSMSDEDAPLFENIILRITRVEKKTPQASSMNRQLAFRSWTNWEVARESDRVWREWWDGAPICCLSSTQSDAALPSDSGFGEASFLEDQRIDPSAASASPSSDLTKPRLQPLDIGKTIYQATLNVTLTNDDTPQHQYQWDSVELDVFRVLLAYEERVSRSGLRAMVSAAMMYVY